jgi:hypothetical protein
MPWDAYSKAITSICEVACIEKGFGRDEELPTLVAHDSHADVLKLYKRRSK